MFQQLLQREGWRFVFIRPSQALRGLDALFYKIAIERHSSVPVLLSRLWRTDSKKVGQWHLWHLVVTFCPIWYDQEESTFPPSRTHYSPVYLVQNVFGIP